MHLPEPLLREAGTGPVIVCIHSNAGTSGQWCELMGFIAPKFHVFAPDSCDSGKSPESPSDRTANLRDEVAFLEPVLTRAGSPLVAWGGSIGSHVR